MGYIAHDAVIVTVCCLGSSGGPDVPAFRESMPEELRPLLVGPIDSPVNGYQTWFFAPDGSKEGWDESEAGDLWRSRFADLWRDEAKNAVIDAVGVRYGGDYSVECGAHVTDLIDEDDEL